jgi:uncharacterized protein
MPSSYAGSASPFRKTKPEMLDPELLAILVCPKCKGELRYEQSPPSLVCPVCALRYPVRDDIPILLIDEAQPLGSV